MEEWKGDRPRIVIALPLFFSLPLLLLFLVLLWLQKEHFDPFAVFSFPKSELFNMSFSSFFISFSHLNPLPLEVLPGGNSHCCILHTPAFFYHLFLCLYLYVSLFVFVVTDKTAEGTFFVQTWLLL